MNNKHEEAVKLLQPVMNFEWIWGNCDGDPSDLFENPDDVAFDLNNDNSIVKVGELDGSLVLTATVNFDLDVKDGVTEDQISEWLSDNSAYACGYIGSGWTYIESDGDNVWLVNDIDRTDFAGTDSVLFEWSMEGGQIDEESIEDPKIQKALEKAKALIADGEHEKAIQTLPKLHFEFSGRNLDSDPSEFFTEDLEFSFEIDPNNEMHKISLELDNDDLFITISVTFALPVKDGIDISELNEWLDDNGGYYAGLVYGGWGWSGDNGGQLICTS
jgi:hypothetical protein